MTCSELDVRLGFPSSRMDFDLYTAGLLPRTGLHDCQEDIGMIRLAYQSIDISVRLLLAAEYMNAEDESRPSKIF